MRLRLCRSRLDSHQHGNEGQNRSQQQCSVSEFETRIQPNSGYPLEAGLSGRIIPYMPERGNNYLSGQIRELCSRSGNFCPFGPKVAFVRLQGLLESSRLYSQAQDLRDLADSCLTKSAESSADSAEFGHHPELPGDKRVRLRPGRPLNGLSTQARSRPSVSTSQACVSTHSRPRAGIISICLPRPWPNPYT